MNFTGFDRALVDLLWLLDFLFMVVTPLSSECMMEIYSGFIVLASKIREMCKRVRCVRCGQFWLTIDGDAALCK